MVNIIALLLRILKYHMEIIIMLVISLLHSYLILFWRRVVPFSRLHTFKSHKLAYLKYLVNEVQLYVYIKY